MGGSSGAGGSAGPGGSAGAGGQVVFTDGAAGSGASDAGFVDPEGGCAVQRQDSKPIPTDIFIMLDKSISMNCPATDASCTQATTAVLPTRWSAVTDGINNFVNNPANAGIGVGLGIFDYSADAEMCIPENYVNAAIGIATLPAGGAAVLDKISITTPGGVTPTQWALEGAIIYVKRYMAKNPGRTAAVVFVTDGMPNSPLCISTLQDAADYAKAAFEGTPSVETYVVGLGRTATLELIAIAGSGGAHHYIDANGDPATVLRDELKLVSHPITCDYPIPVTGAPLNYDNVDVQTRASDTDAPLKLKYVTSASACTSTPAWYYDTPPPGIPTKITLCPSACDPLKVLTTASVQAVIGCVPRIN
jgi:hypothetical protein